MVPAEYIGCVLRALARRAPHLELTDLIATRVECILDLGAAGRRNEGQRVLLRRRGAVIDPRPPIFGAQVPNKVAQAVGVLKAQRRELCVRLVDVLNE